MSALVPGQIASNATAAGSSITATLSSTPTPGNLLVAIAFTTTDAIPVVTGFTSAVINAQVVIYYKVAGTSESPSVVATKSFGYIGLIVYEFSGGATQLGSVNNNSGSGTSATTKPVGVAHTDEVVVAGVAASNDMGSGGGWSAPFTTNSPDSTRGKFGYVTNPSIGDINPTVSWTNSFIWSSAIARFVVPGEDVPTVSDSTVLIGGATSSINGAKIVKTVNGYSSVTTPNDAGVFDDVDDILYANGLFVAVVSGGDSSNAIITSPDGVNWTRRVANGSGSTAIGGAITYSPELGLWIVGYNRGATRAIQSSPDGITWTDRNTTTLTAGIIRSAGWDGSLFLVGTDGGKLISSPDGITWTDRTNAVVTDYERLIYAKELDLWVVVGKATTNRHIATSPDGITWTSRIAPGDSSLGVYFAIGWNGSLFVAQGHVSGIAYAATSPDGITWTSRTSPWNGQTVSSYQGDVVWDGEQWLAGWVPSDGATCIATSPDGITWSLKPGSGLIRAISLSVILKHLNELNQDAIGYIYENVGFNTVNTQEASGQIFENVGVPSINTKEGISYVFENVIERTSMKSSIGISLG